MKIHISLNTTIKIVVNGQNTNDMFTKVRKRQDKPAITYSRTLSLSRSSQSNDGHSHVHTSK